MQKKIFLNLLNLKKKVKILDINGLEFFMCMALAEKRVFDTIYKKSLKNNLELKFKTPNKAHDFIYIDDVCRFIVSSLKKI